MRHPLIRSFIKTIIAESAAEDDFLVYFDMDGVLADFDAGVSRSSRVTAAQRDLEKMLSSPKYSRFAGASEDELKAALKGKQADPDMATLKKAVTAVLSGKFAAAEQPGFFLSLPVLPGARELVALATRLTGRKPHVLTAPITSVREQCEREKLQWIERNFPGAFDDFHCTLDKHVYAAPNAILIDDMEKYVGPFRGAGGIAILHRNPVATARELEDILQRDI